MDTGIQEYLVGTCIQEYLADTGKEEYLVDTCLGVLSGYIYLFHFRRIIEYLYNQ